MVAAVYCNREPLSWNRENLSGYFEVYVEASLETVIRRDPKGICKGSRAGKIPDVVGIDIPFQKLASPDFLIDADDQAPHRLSRQVLPRRSRNCRLFLPKVPTPKLQDR